MTPNPHTPTPVEGELLPCPFCGGKPILEANAKIGFRIHCKCAMSPDTGWSMLGDSMWNERSPSPSTIQNLIAQALMAIKLKEELDSRSPSLQERGMEKDEELGK